MNKHFLQLIVSIAEVCAYAFTAIGAVSGVTYLVFNRHLVKIVEDENTSEKTRLTAEIAAANARAAEAHSTSASAQTQADLAVQRTEEARLKQEQLRQDNLKLGIKYEEERIARLKIESRLADRHIDFLALAAKLPVMNGIAVHMQSLAGDNEAFRYAQLIAEGLQRSGAHLVKGGIDSVVTSGRIAPITINAGKNRHTVSTAIVNALVDSGVARESIEVNPSADDNLVELVIGPK